MFFRGTWANFPKFNVMKDLFLLEEYTSGTFRQNIFSGAVKYVRIEHLFFHF